MQVAVAQVTEMMQVLVGWYSSLLRALWVLLFC